MAILISEVSAYHQPMWSAIQALPSYGIPALFQGGAYNSFCVRVCVDNIFHEKSVVQALSDVDEERMQPLFNLEPHEWMCFKYYARWADQPVITWARVKGTILFFFPVLYIIDALREKWPRSKHKWV